MLTPNLRLADFDYALPTELIAQKPAEKRSQSRLLRIAPDATLHDHPFTDLPSFLRSHDLLVFNNTKVMKARLLGAKQTGGKIEGLVERLLSPDRALMHIKASKAPKANTDLIFSNAVRAKVLGRQGDLFEVAFESDILDILNTFGSLPLPPYIDHAPNEDDDERYQTIYADCVGAVAAPTAGLHFDQTILNQLTAQGVNSCFVTLHVGAGTFQPVRTNTISEHIMHAEWYNVPQHAVEAIAKSRANGGRVFAVGTTSVRALESAAVQAGLKGQGIPNAHQGDTQLFITPGYPLKVVDGLLTNFHLPQSTLLMLVAAFIGIDTMQKAYTHAIAQQYRFFSYGDSMLIEPTF